MEKIYKTKSTKETQELAQNFAKELTPGSFLALYGNLGAGKTTFVQGLAKGLGIEKRLISPTFIIVRSYALPSDNMFYHVDLYRLRGEEDIESTGLLEILEDKNAIVAVEWPEKLGSLLPKNRYDITLSPMLDTERSITIKNK